MLPDPPIQDRIEQQTFPSVMTGWHHFVLNLPELSYDELVSYHDLFWGSSNLLTSVSTSSRRGIDW